MTNEEIIKALRVCYRGECDGCLTPEQACGALCTEAASALENLVELARENDKREDEAEENAANLKHKLACKQTENNILRGELRRMFLLYVAAETRADAGVNTEELDETCEAARKKFTIINGGKING